MSGGSHEEVRVPRVMLGSHGLEVSKLGLGCMGLSGGYNSPLSDEDGISVIKHAFSKGITFFDTADVYGGNANEVLLGKALKFLPREKVQVATKFGIIKWDGNYIKVKGTPEYARACCEASLKRLGVDYIDLYYQHRVDKYVPIEDTIGELKKLVNEGKIRHIGLSEASANTIRRAHAVHPITAVQLEWSLWTRDIEDEIVPLCRELGIGIVPYSPLGRGFFGGKAVVESLPEVSSLNSHPRFQKDSVERNKIYYSRVEAVAQKHGCTPAQMALAWVLHQGDDVVPIPGTTKIKNLESNIGSLNLKLTKEDLQELSDLIPVNDVAGDRTYISMDTVSWRVADTPLKRLMLPSPVTNSQSQRSVAAFATKSGGGFSINSIINKCQTCASTGAIECPGCKGTGRNKKNGNIFERWKCYDCQGFGLKSCPACGKGVGLTREQRGER